MARGCCRIGEGRRSVFIGERNKNQKHIRKKSLVYDKKVFNALKKIWYILDFPCGRDRRVT